MVTSNLPSTDLDRVWRSVFAQSETRMRDHMSLCANACQGVK